jgi:hypothetical protein
VAGQHIWCVWTAVVECHINVKQNITSNMSVWWDTHVQDLF